MVTLTLLAFFAKSEHINGINPSFLTVLLTVNFIDSSQKTQKR